MVLGRTSSLPTLLLAAALAGCLTNPTDLDDAGDRLNELAYYVQDVMPVDIDHDHANASLHALDLNLELVAYTSCTSKGDVASAIHGYTDIAFHEDFAFVGNSRGFCILDISHPQEPHFVSQYAGEGSSDLEVSSDGKYVFLLTQRNRVTSLTDAGEPTSNLPRGVSVVNVEDVENPVFESYYPVPTNGVHTATSYTIGSRQLLFINTYDWVPPRELLPAGVDVPVPASNAPVTQRVEITELVAGADGAMSLKRLSTWSLARPTTEPMAEWFPHDGFAQFHPVIKKQLYYIAYWDAGLVILDVDEPASPKLVSQFSDIAPSVYNQYHDVKPFPHLIAGRHITVTGPEIPSGPEAGHVRVFDTTDPANPVQLGTWRLPGNPGTPGGFLFSPHVFTLHDGRIYIGHNHGGVWVIDVHNETLLAQPASAGFYFPRGNVESGDLSPTSSVWGAYWQDGYVYATEGTSGVHVLHFAGDYVMEAVEMTDEHADNH